MKKKETVNKASPEAKSGNANSGKHFAAVACLAGAQRSGNNKKLFHCCCCCCFCHLASYFILFHFLLLLLFFFWGKLLSFGPEQRLQLGGGDQGYKFWL